MITASGLFELERINERDRIKFVDRILTVDNVIVREYEMFDRFDGFGVI